MMCIITSSDLRLRAQRRPLITTAWVSSKNTDINASNQRQEEDKRWLGRFTLKEWWMFSFHRWFIWSISSITCNGYISGDKRQNHNAVSSIRLPVIIYRQSSYLWMLTNQKFDGLQPLIVEWQRQFENTVEGYQWAMRLFFFPGLE